MDILLANPRGFCAGVERAIAIVERALEKFGAPIYVRHEVVHNRYVVDDLKSKGAIFIEELSEVPDGATLIFSAHGVPQSVRREAEQRGLNVFDATCPLVTKVHLEVARLRKQGYEIVMIGHKGHPEVEGTMGQSEGGMYLVENAADVASLKVGSGETGVSQSTALHSSNGPAPGRHSASEAATAPDEPKLAYVTQTTLSVDDAATITGALKRRFPSIVGPKKDDICYATQNRQDAVKQLAGRVDVVIVVGSKNSSNSSRLREVAENMGVRAQLVDNAAQIDEVLIQGAGSIGVTAGASAPEILVSGVIERLSARGPGTVATADGVQENVSFPIPKELN